MEKRKVSTGWDWLARFVRHLTGWAWKQYILDAIRLTEEREARRRAEVLEMMAGHAGANADEAARLRKLCAAMRESYRRSKGRDMTFRRINWP